jgi:methyl-accepting chemotaxis protein
VVDDMMTARSADITRVQTALTAIVRGEDGKRIIEQIAAASREQSDGIEQVNQAIGQMDQVTQQNAALVEEASAAAASMREQAASLAAAVSIFKVAGPAVLPAGART